ncbi:hypothetical protein HSBAA_48490 [Vreelandella sulfidaeris]|uniref:MarR family transcriptional regulator n=1 Tax=Vreelandella sulfidaeris TaxID=115553 RepID=A0A455UE13_9GAMM|nr:hypothetical protein HSBAA_48490 [Halomonas sulfidaeris]
MSFIHFLEQTENMTESPLSQANALPGNLLRRCHQISVAIFLRKCEANNLTQLQYIILSALDEMGSLDQITLGGFTALDRNTVAIVVKSSRSAAWSIDAAAPRIAARCWSPSPRPARHCA